MGGSQEWVKKYKCNYWLTLTLVCECKSNFYNYPFTSPGIYFEWSIYPGDQEYVSTYCDSRDRDAKVGYDSFKNSSGSYDKQADVQNGRTSQQTSYVIHFVVHIYGT